MKQTAIAWLLENLNSEPYSEEEFNYNRDCWDKALEMEKEQIIDAWDKRGDRIVPKYFLKENINGEQYYNETFKNSEQ